MTSDTAANPVADIETVAKKWALKIVTSADFLEEAPTRGKNGNDMYHILTEALAEALTRIQTEA